MVVRWHAFDMACAGLQGDRGVVRLALPAPPPLLRLQGPPHACKSRRVKLVSCDPRRPATARARFLALPAFLASVAWTGAAPAQETPASTPPPEEMRLPVAPPVGRGATAAPAPHPRSAGAPSGGEEMPPVSKGEFFSEAQIRWCLAQRVRIDSVRPMLNRYDQEEVRQFNHQVADLNARCSSYRYYGTNLPDAKAWLEVERTRIEREARDAHLAAAAERAGRAVKPGARHSPHVLLRWPR